MKNSDIFNQLFIFEMANNHMGDLSHGIRIIREFYDVCKNYKFRFGFKLQYRDLDTFIHPDYKNRMDIKYVKRFSETRLSEDEFKLLISEIKKHNFIPICTPFDEISVDRIEDHGFEIIKIASSSFTDWPLLERIAKTQKPIVISTAGATLEEIDQVVSFLDHRKKQFCVMHCVGEYPTKSDHLELNQIDFLKKRYPDIPIGYSTHEEPENYIPVQIAIGKGAVVFERHIGIKTESYSLNDYSSTPNQINCWLSAAEKAYNMCGVVDQRRECSEKEISDLKGLKRGFFAKHLIKSGERIGLDNTFFAIPTTDNQIQANDFSKYIQFTVINEISPDNPVLFENVMMKNEREKFLQIVKKVRDILIESKITLPNRIDFELSHHYGIDRFEEWGAVIINCVNREYCKKIIILLSGQKHPIHFHQKKEETFQVLYGDVLINLAGNEHEYAPGEIIVVERGIKHSFCSKNGAIFEEISTTHYKNDSFYEDERITNNQNRKTEMTFWADWLTRPVS